MNTATETKYESLPSWMASHRRFESADTNRINSAHWTFAQDESVNAWLLLQLGTMRARAAYECKQNGMILGMVNTHADDVVGQDGPSLQVVSDDPAYNEALEQLWADWFAAPTPNPEVSGVTLLKLFVRSLWRNGEFVAPLVTDKAADGPVKLRIHPVAPRLLATPADYAGDANVFMGIRCNQLRRPTQYYVFHMSLDGSQTAITYDVVPADLLIHKYLVEEEEQLRGIPWLNTSLSPAADLRDYDDSVQDAARQIADQCGILTTNHPDAEPWLSPESVNVERQTIKTAPPGWDFNTYSATQPPVQYPDYRAERQREFGRPAGMPLATIRLDYAKYNYSSARLETQNYQRAVASLQTWLSGTQRSAGPLNRLATELAAEARFILPQLSVRPKNVRYQWTWPQRPHVDPTKEANAEAIALENGTTSLIDVLANRGEDLERHVGKLLRVNQAFEDAGLPLPAWTGMSIDPAAVDAVLALGEE